MLIPLIVLIGVPVGMGAERMWWMIHPECGDGGKTPADVHLAYRDVTLPARDGSRYRAFFVPGSQSAPGTKNTARNALILIPPTYSSGRDGPMAEIAILAGHGYSVLTFESRACMSTRVISLGSREVDDVGDALDYLQRNPDRLPISADQMAHIGIFGFSSAGATATMAAARYPQLAALITEGGYHNASMITGLTAPANPLEALIYFGGQIAYRLGTGADPAALDPLDAVPKIVPRPILFIYGSREVTLPGARLQLAAAHAANPRASAELWVVPGADHGGYRNAVGTDEYARFMLPFFDCALVGDCVAYHALWATF